MKRKLFRLKNHNLINTNNTNYEPMSKPVFFCWLEIFSLQNAKRKEKAY